MRTEPASKGSADNRAKHDTVFMVETDAASVSRLFLVAKQATVLVSDRDQIRGRFIYNKVEGLDTNAQLPTFYAPQPVRNYLTSFSEFHNFSPTLQNKFRAAFNRNFNSIQTGQFTFPGLSAFPNLTIDDLNSTQIGPDPNTPTGSIQNLLQLQDNVIKTVGRHTLKFGYHFTDVILTNYFIQRVRGDYEYSTLERYLQDLSPTFWANAAPDRRPIRLGFCSTRRISKTISASGPT